LLDLPRYAADIQRRIEEKGTLVTTSSDYTEVWSSLHLLAPSLGPHLFSPLPSLPPQVVKENLTVEFEERIRQSYEWLLEQQMNRLKRIQGRY
jgi:hypothetical protein